MGSKRVGGSLSPRLTGRVVCRREFLAWTGALGGALLLPGCVTGVGGGTTPTSVGYRVPESIPADESVDVTAELQSFFNRVPDGSIINFPSNARYRMDGTLLFSNRWGLTILGNGARFRRIMRNPSGEASLFRFVLGGDLILRHLVWQGDNPNAGTGNGAFDPVKQWQSALRLGGVDGALVDGCNAYDVYGDFIEVGDLRQPPWTWSKDITIRGCTFKRSGRQGISVNAADGVDIDRNVLEEVQMSTFDLEPAFGTQGVRNVTVRGNKTRNGRLTWFANSGGSTDPTNGNIRVIANEILEDDLIGVSDNTLIDFIAPAGSRRAQCVIEDNVLLARTGSNPVNLFERIDGLEFNRNVITIPAARTNKTGLRLTDCTGFRVRYNRFIGGTTVWEVIGSSNNIEAFNSFD